MKRNGMKRGLFRRKMIQVTQIITLRLRRQIHRYTSGVSNFKKAPKIVSQSTVLGIFAFFLPEIPSWINDWFPTWATQKHKDYFIWPGIELEKPYQLVWMLKFSSSDLQKFIILYLAAKISKQYSTHLFLFFAIWTFYSLVDMILLWVNFKLWHLFYLDLLTTAFILTMGVFKGYNEKSLSRVKSLF